MKKLLCLFLIFGILLLAGCSTPDSSGNSSPSGSDIPDSSYTSSVSQTGTGDYLEDENSAEESSEDASDATSVSDRDGKDREKNDPGTGKSEGTTKETESSDIPKDSLPSQSSDDNNSSENQKPSENTNPVSKPTETKSPQTEPTESNTETTQPPAEETSPEERQTTFTEMMEIALQLIK